MRFRHEGMIRFLVLISVPALFLGYVLIGRYGLSLSGIVDGLIAMSQSVLRVFDNVIRSGSVLIWPLASIAVGSLVIRTSSSISAGHNAVSVMGGIIAGFSAALLFWWLPEKDALTGGAVLILGMLFSYGEGRPLLKVGGLLMVLILMASMIA